MSGFGARTYLVGQILPLMLKDLVCPASASTAEKLNEAIRLTLYITDLTLARMGYEIKHDWEAGTSTERPQTSETEMDGGVAERNE